MPHIIFHFIVAGLGRIWIFIRYPQKEKRKVALAAHYKGSYEIAGKRVMLVLVILIFITELVVDFFPDLFYAKGK